MPQRRRFAAARGPEEADELAAGSDLKTEILIDQGIADVVDQQ